MRGCFVEWEFAVSHHGRYVLFTENGRVTFTVFYLVGAGSEVASKPVDNRDAIKGEVLGTFKSRSESTRAAERHHEAACV